MDEKKEQSAAEQLKEQLFLRRKHAALLLEDGQIKQADDFCEGYKAFLQQAKTEREANAYFIRLAQENGFTPYDPQKKYAPGDKVYADNRGKALLLAVIGQKSCGEGVSIVAAHIDSPRIDLKQNPLYEEAELALLKTHYYGGIKKYQWTAIPLALHGVVLRKDGSSVCVNLGENADDPQFVITDLLPHLGQNQAKRTLNEGIAGEELNILVGSRPFRDDKAGELVKLNILRLLHEKYGIVEEDFLSAELELVPAFPVRDIGFDRSMLGGYGHDDRVCAYPEVMALLDLQKPQYTAVAVLADKEEVGSDGNTGMQSAFFTDFIADLARSEGLLAHDVLRRSLCLSADVNAGFDPTWPDVMERQNAAYMNKGVVVTKYTGSRGKAGTSDASAEFVSQIRSLFDAAGVIWQTGELGKVDAGGGGTVAMYIANLNVDVIDVGVPVLSMHAPLEVVAKLDVYMAYKAFAAFVERNPTTTG